MEIVQKRLSELRPSEKNVRRHNQNQIKELAKAINEFDVIRPIICDENGVILCGHGLYEALQFRGDETADCVIKAGLNDKQKKKLMLADNKIYDLGTSDYDVIDEILREFGQEGDFSVPGYDADTLEDLYGVRSVEQAAQAVHNVIPTPPSSVAESQTVQPDAHESVPTPSAHVQEERAQAMMRRVVVCPHCGGTIEI